MPVGTIQECRVEYRQHRYNNSPHTLFEYFTQHPNVKMRSDNQTLTNTDISDIWLNVMGLVRVKGDNQGWLTLAYVVKCRIITPKNYPLGYLCSVGFIVFTIRRANI